MASPLVETQEAESIWAGLNVPGLDDVGVGEGATHEGLPPPPTRLRRGRDKTTDLPPLGLSDSVEEEIPPPQMNLYSRGRNLRNRPRINFTEQEEPEEEEEEPEEEDEPKDDHYLYCEECKCFFMGECELHGPPLFTPDTPVVLGVSDRARLTLPHGLEVRRSEIPGAGLGVFNCGDVVAKGTHYGPYEGEVMKKEEATKRDSWVIYKSRNCNEYIDVKRETHSNWMRYVNCARAEEEQNLVAVQYRGGILYRCRRQLAVGEELLVWYGQEYSYKSISFDYLWNRKSTAREVMPELSAFSCSECPFSYTSQIYLHKHIKRCHDNLYTSLLRSGEIRPENLSSSSSRSLPITNSNTPLSPAPTRRQRDMDKPRPSGKSFTREGNPRTHQHSQTGQRPYHCDQCEKNFSLEAHLRTHQLIHAGEKPYHCDQCGKNFNRADNLRRHQSVHTGVKPYHCDQCGKNFSQRGDLKAHQSVHTGEKPYHCDQCGKNFTREPHLTRHLRIHTGKKLYPCDQCGSSFTQSSDLRLHQRVHTGEKPYHCDQCGKNFSRDSNFRTHLLMHAGKKPYPCDQCGNSFTQSSDLRLHQRVHTGEKPYHCDECGKNFAREPHLKVHQRVHTGEKPYHCVLCGKNFPYEPNLKRHYRVHTRKK